ncbi:hypothetical protein [Chryseobacterium indoltheticum]|uniref:Uncharacterized protein n=1 Tax=Chryseobacterium indoltheticum TaxID=254 RepID=A0A381FRL6_9FLAO|nr:hypothetical protein [Chryseobacterium indoltheticum]SUX48811.1 Uncharacterised protein [Chryseobacterium indoltheticum]
MQRNYNYIYSNLVEKESDLIGHIAYSLYKKSKIEYIEKQKADGKDVSDTDLIPFNNFSSSDSSIESYKIKAELIVQGFIDNVLEEELENYKEQAVNQQAQILQNIINPLTTGFWKSVWAGFVSAFIFALFLAVIAFIIQFNGSTININVNKVENP